MDHRLEKPKKRGASGICVGGSQGLRALIWAETHEMRRLRPWNLRLNHLPSLAKSLEMQERWTGGKIAIQEGF